MTTTLTPVVIYGINFNPGCNMAITLSRVVIWQQIYPGLQYGNNLNPRSNMATNLTPVVSWQQL